MLFAKKMKETKYLFPTVIGGRHRKEKESTVGPNIFFPFKRIPQSLFCQELSINQPIPTDLLNDVLCCSMYIRMKGKQRYNDG